VVSAGSYILSALALAAVVLSIGFSAYRLRQRLLPEWDGAPARLVESVVGIGLLVLLAELLGVFGLLYAWILVVASLLLAVVMALLPAGPVGAGDPPPLPVAEASSGVVPPAPPPAGGADALKLLFTVGVVAVVFAHWGLTAKDALDRGIFNFDSLWYHMPFAAEMAKSHSVTGFHYTETVFTNWLYPQNSELLHAVGILLIERDTLSLFINFGFLGLAFLAAWCIGRPYGRGHLTVAAAAVLLECHTLVVREPGAAKNDVVAAALLLAAVAILINWSAFAGRGWGLPGQVRRPVFRTDHSAREASPKAKNPAPDWATPTPAPTSTAVPLAIAGLAVGLAVGTKSTALAMAAALSLAVIVLAPVGRRWVAAAWWFLPALAGGGFWYLRNLIAAGNPLPQLESIGPISLPHPERLQSGRPDFSIAHYATDTGVWREYFGPGLDQAFGALWPLVAAAAVAGALIALIWGRERALRWMGGVALFAMVAYLFTPLSAAGAEGAPTGFGINIRYAIPALLLGIVLLPLARVFDGERRQWGLLAALLVVLLLTDRADAVLRDPDRLFGLLVALLAVLIPAALLYARRRGASLAAVATGFGALALATVAIGYPVQREYLEDRFRNEDPERSIPGFELDSAYRWARDVEDSRIGLAGTTAGFLQYGLYGTDLSNRVRYLGARGPHRAFNAIPTCAEFRESVNDAELDYLITAPFLNFLNPSNPIPSPEATWLRGDPAVVPIKRTGPVTVWRIQNQLNPAACGPINAPVRRVPDTPEDEGQ
jgi:hypothetical protein